MLCSQNETQDEISLHSYCEMSLFVSIYDSIRALGPYCLKLRMSSPKTQLADSEVFDLLSHHPDSPPNKTPNSPANAYHRTEVLFKTPP